MQVLTTRKFSLVILALLSLQGLCGERAANVLAAPVTSRTTSPADGSGLYQSCDPRLVYCLKNLETFAAAGFSVVINYSQFARDATIADEEAYAAHATEWDMKVIWPVNDFIYTNNADTTLQAAYPTLAASMAASGQCPSFSGDNYGFASCFIRIVAALPGTWGYYIGDETPASSETDLRHLVDAIVDTDPTHPRLYVATEIGDETNTAALETFSRSYCDGSGACHPDATVILQDFYPVGTPMAPNAKALTGQIAAGVRSLAEANNAGYGMVLQAHSLSEYPDQYPSCGGVAVCPYPTKLQMRDMRDAALAQGRPRLILWYSYFDLLRSGSYLRHWSDLLQAAVDVRAVCLTSIRFASEDDNFDRFGLMC